MNIRLPAPDLTLQRTLYRWLRAKAVSAAFVVLVGGVLLLSACTGSTGLPGRTPIALTTPSVTPFVFPPTYTPLPTLPATATSTPFPTRTPLPTPTLASTAEPSATPIFSISPATGMDQPVITSGMLFLKEGQLQIWPRDGLALVSIGDGLLPEKVRQISTTPDTGIIATLSETAGGFQVIVFDRFQNEILLSLDVLAADIPELAISPDGSALVYIEIPFAAPVQTATPSATPTADPEPFATETALPSPTQLPGTGRPAADPDGTSIVWVGIAAQSEPEPVAQCGPRCAGLLWDPQGAAFVWAAEDGLYRALRAAGQPEPVRVAEPFLVSTLGSGAGTDSYLPISFSPSGRYLLVRKGLSTGSVLSVVDLTAGLVENVPGAGVYSGSPTGITWMFGDLLFIARPGIERLELLPAGEIWAIDTDSAGFFTLFSEYSIPGDTNTIPDAPVQLPDGRIGFTLNNYRAPDDPAMNGLFLLDPAAGSVEKVNHLPILRVEAVYWLPDGTGALIDSSSRLLFVPAGFGQIYTMTTLFGNDACCFRWIP